MLQYIGLHIMLQYIGLHIMLQYIGSHIMLQGGFSGPCRSTGGLYHRLAASLPDKGIAVLQALEVKKPVNSK